MTRELKFRAWCEEEKRYTDKPFCQCHDGSCTFLDAVQFINGKVSTLIPEQYTGLKDKNGVEIYEGDIIDYNSDGQALGYVKYNAPHYELIDKEGYTMFLKGAPHQTIIGNIHENPELLGGEE